VPGIRTLKQQQFDKVMGRLSYRYEKEKEPLSSGGGSSSTLLFERRVLTFVTCLLGVGLVSWLAAVSTDYWVVVVAGYNGTVLEDKIYLWSHSGLWRKCHIFAFLNNRTDHVTRCTYHSFAQGTEAEENWVPTELAFVIIVLLLISLSGGFSIYSLYHPRYTFKRVASGLHCLTWLTLIGFIKGMVESDGHVSQHHDEFESHRLKTAEAAAEAAAAGGGNVQHYYGYSYLMAWITFIISILASLAFLAWSKKRKHSSHDLETQLK